MSVVQIKRGNAPPSIGDLEPYELGYSKSNNRLFIGQGTDETPEAPRELSEIYIGSIQPDPNLGYKLWVDTTGD